MTKLLNPNQLLILLLISISFFACGDEDPLFTPTGEPEMEELEMTNTIVDIALGDDQFSTLVAALQKADLVDALNGSDILTVFAPTNDAFNALLSDLGASSLDDVETETLRNILLYHVVATKVESGDLTNGYVSTLSTGPGDNPVSLLVNIENGVILNNGPKVTTADVQADNGVVHVIDKVLVPPTVVDLAVSNGGFGSLVSALLRADLATTLQGEGPFTVFAPTDAAFTGLMSDLSVASLDDIPLETLKNVLLYHVVSGNVRSTDLSNGDVATLNDANMLTVNTDGGVTLNTDVNVILTDIQGTNGVVHVIDRVLSPAN